MYSVRYECTHTDIENDNDNHVQRWYNKDDNNRLHEFVVDVIIISSKGQKYA